VFHLQFPPGRRNDPLFRTPNNAGVPARDPPRGPNHAYPMGFSFFDDASSPVLQIVRRGFATSRSVYIPFDDGKSNLKASALWLARQPATRDRASGIEFAVVRGGN